MKTTALPLCILLATGVLATACGKTDFAQSNGATRDGIAELVGNESQSGTRGNEDATEGIKAELPTKEKALGEGEADADLKSGQTPVDDSGIADADLKSKQAQGWSLTCNGHLFKGVFGKSEATGFGLLGWGGGGEGPSFDDNKPTQAGALGLLDDCMDIDLVSLRSKGLQYVIVKFDATDFQVTEAKAFHPTNFPNANVANYNQCAQIAGAPAATQSIPEMQALVAASKLAGKASCGTEACCIDIK